MTFNPARGCIASIIEKATGAELVDTNSAHGFGQYLYQQYSRKERHDDVNSYILPRKTRRPAGFLSRWP